MEFDINDFLKYKYSSISMGILLATLVSMWAFDTGKRKLQLFFLFLIFAFMGQHISILGLILLSFYGMLAWISFRSNWHGWTAFIFFIGFLASSVFFFIHQVPGFYNWQLADAMKLGATDVKPYSMWLNFDKPMIAVFGLLWGVPLCLEWSEFKKMIKITLLPLIIVLTVIPIMSVVMGFVTWDPKWEGELHGVWFVRNLFLVVLAEEVFFRGFIQMKMRKWLQRKRKTNSGFLAVIFGAVLFGMAHIAGGWDYVALSTAAGLLYGWAQYRTGYIESAIILHIALNTVHFTFFSYPGLAPS